MLWLRDVAALFTDYDGTIAPVDVVRELSKPPREVYEALSEISKLIPIAVISTKDCDFLVKRTDFARAWSCTYGLEIRVGSNVIINGELIKWQDGFTSLLNLIRELVGSGAYIEVKHVGNLVGGVSIDWRRGSIDRNALARIIERARDMGFRVIEYKNHPFIDIYPGIPVNKGYAVTKLRELLNINGPIMYLGDSENDVDAMRLVEYPVGVRHKYNVDLNLPVKLWVDEKELPNFLWALYKQLVSKTNVN
ncbi:trehalose-phosphatase [Vulcanisaeta thermophila]|uniref:trehalose-phosphatase n=1 Tax=Vulcanisaeta thermophila TaxID=867917 RepID=UPI0008529817|nr:HAD-IIB family hydrolase [Vulcanisaeta thermophila]